MQDIFRFVFSRPPQIHSKKDGSTFVNTHDDLPKSQFLKDLKDAHKNEDGNLMRETAIKFIKSSLFVSDLRKLDIPLESIDSWLIKHENKPELIQLSNKIEGNCSMVPSTLLKSKKYIKDRQRVSDSLLALTITRESNDATRDKLTRAMLIFGLLEKIVLKSKTITSNEIYQQLVNGTILLPSELFPLPRNNGVSAKQLKSGSLGSIGEKKGSSVSVEDHRKKLDKIETAIEEIVSAFNSELSKRRAVQKDRPRKGKLNSTSSGKSLEITNSPRFDRTPWSLPSSALTKLSKETRNLTKDVIGNMETLGVHEMVSRLELEAANTTKLMTTPDNTSEMTSIGSGLVSTRSLLSTGFSGLSAAGEAGISHIDSNQTMIVSDLGLARVPAIGDLMVVRTTKTEYEEGEIAHIENVLKGEKKERIFKTSTTREEEVFVEAEEEKHESHDLQSTEKSEMQVEVDKTIHQDSRLEAGVTVTASYGPVSATVSANASTAYSSDEANRMSSQYARDVTERTASSITKRTLTQRTSRIRSVIEETNTHGFVPSSTNTIGIYRWINKKHEARAYRYDMRLLLEFIVPEPAAFYLHALGSRPVEGLTLTRPDPPENPTTDYHTPLSSFDLNFNNYQILVTKYNVPDVEPPPKRYLTLGLAWAEKTPPPSSKGEDDKPTTGNEVFFFVSKMLKIPDGYKAMAYIAQLQKAGNRFSTLTVGGSYVLLENRDWAWQKLWEQEGDLPIVLYHNDPVGYGISLEVWCERTPEAYVKWQDATYNSIMNAYYELKRNYDEQVLTISARKGIHIEGRNPLENRNIEKTELKKGIISMFNRDHLESFDAIDISSLPGNYPEIDFEKAKYERDIIQFFEQAFEWSQMIYTFYPYFWGRNRNWITTSQINDPDFIFAEFLKAGAARVVVPVRPSFDKMILHYLKTKQIWKGTTIPQINDPTYVSIIQEIMDQQNAGPAGTPIGPAWPVVIPTDLVRLSETSDL